MTLWRFSTIFWVWIVLFEYLTVLPISTLYSRRSWLLWFHTALTRALSRTLFPKTPLRELPFLPKILQWGYRGCLQETAIILSHMTLTFFILRKIYHWLWMRIPTLNLKNSSSAPFMMNFLGSLRCTTFALTPWKFHLLRNRLIRLKESSLHKVLAY